jgi:hypothetical protein
VFGGHRRAGGEAEGSAHRRAGQQRRYRRLTPAEVAHALVLSIEQLTPEQNGKFMSITGKEVPW